MKKKRCILNLFVIIPFLIALVTPVFAENADTPADPIDPDPYVVRSIAGSTTVKPAHQKSDGNAEFVYVTVYANGTGTFNNNGTLVSGTITSVYTSNPSAMTVTSYSTGYISGGIRVTCNLSCPSGYMLPYYSTIVDAY